jgi:hypothetical protein
MGRDDLPGDVSDVVADVTVLGDRLTGCCRQQRGGELVDLHARIVDVVLAGDFGTGCLQQTGQ